MKILKASLIFILCLIIFSPASAKAEHYGCCYVDNPTNSLPRMQTLQNGAYNVPESSSLNVTKDRAQPECMARGGTYFEDPNTWAKSDPKDSTKRVCIDKNGNVLVGTYPVQNNPVSNTSANAAPDKNITNGAEVAAKARAAAKAQQNQVLQAPTDAMKYAGYNPAKVIGRVISVLLLILGSIALIMFIFGGFTWMTAMGNDSRVATARKTLIWATAGMIVIFLSYIIVGFLLETAVGDNSGSSSSSSSNPAATSTLQNSSGPVPVNSNNSNPVVMTGIPAPVNTSTVSSTTMTVNNRIVVDESDLPPNWYTSGSFSGTQRNPGLYFTVGKGTASSQADAMKIAMANGKQNMSGTGSAISYRVVRTKTVTTSINTVNSYTVYILFAYRRN